MTQDKATLIVDRLRLLYEQGIPLYGSALQKNDPWLWQRVYSPQQTGGKPFKSISDARIALADHYRLHKREEDALAVLAFNERKAPNRLDPEVIAKRKQELIDMLLAKRDSGETLSFRAQLKIDKLFVSRTRRIFNGYDNIFEAAGLEREDYSRSIKLPLEYYFSVVYQMGLAKQPVDKVTVSSVDPSVVQAFDRRFGNYYNGLAALQQMLIDSGRSKEAPNFDAQRWKNYRFSFRITDAQNHRESQLEKVRRINEKTKLDSIVIKDITFTDCATVEDALRKLRESPHYLLSDSLAPTLGVTPELIRRSLPFRFPRQSILVETRGKRFFFFHESVKRKYEPRQLQRRADGEARILARELGVTYPRIREIRQMHHLGSLMGDSYTFTAQEKEFIRFVTNSEKSFKEQVLSALNKKDEWMYGDLIAEGIPLTYVARRLPHRGGRKNAVFTQQELKTYFTHHYRASLRFLSLEHISQQQGSLMTLRQITAHLKTRAETTLYRAERLVAEHSSAVFAMQKKKRRFVFSANALPIFENWQKRKEIQLLDALRVPSFNLEQLTSTYEDASAALPDNFTVARADFKEFMSKYVAFRNSLTGLVSLNDFNVHLSRLIPILKYMKEHDYNTLHSGTSFSRESLEEMVSMTTKLPPLGDMSSLKQKLEYTAANSNKGLIMWFLQKRGMINDDNIAIGMQALKRAAQRHDPTKGSFSSYAVWALKGGQYYMRKEENLTAKRGFDSLDAPLSDENNTTRMELVADEKVNVHVSADSGFVGDVAKTVLEGLNEKETDILTRRFGLGGTPVQTLEQIGAVYGVTRERIRQIEMVTLKKLRKRPAIMRLLMNSGLSEE